MTKLAERGECGEHRAGVPPSVRGSQEGWRWVQEQSLQSLQNSWTLEGNEDHAGFQAGVLTVRFAL